MSRTPSHGSAGIPISTYRLADRRLSLDELHRGGLLTSAPEMLRDFGFEWCHVHDQPNATELMLDAARALLHQAPVEREDLAGLFVYSGLPSAGPTSASDPISLFRYDLGRIRHELELDEVPVYRLSELGCCGLAATFNLAESVLRDSDRTCSIVLTGDCFGPDARREIMYNVMSDAASAILVHRSSDRNRFLASHEIVQSYYWDSPAHSDEILASYFPLAQRVIERALAKADTPMDRLRWIVPHNVSVRSWEILCGVLGFDPDRVWLSNIAKVGHTVSSDHVINLCDMQAEGAIEPGDRLLLFTFGFGASWSASVFEH